MFDHVTIRVSDRAASDRFYDRVLATLGAQPTSRDELLSEWDDFSLSPAAPDRPVTRALHIGFAAPSRAHVDAFWRAGIESGAPDDGAPGPRPRYGDDYYGGFVRDPDGNSVEAVHHDRVTAGVDHLWIRVADVAASQAFYATIAPHAGLELRHASPERVQFAGPGGSVSLVAGAPRTGNVHLAFPARDDAAVEAFHRAALQAGYRDHGAPGERPEYHPGYYGAYVLDPDGHNVEVVNHHRG